MGSLRTVWIGCTLSGLNHPKKRKKPPRGWPFAILSKYLVAGVGFVEEVKIKIEA
jgi:hypothetical protein